MKRGRKVAVTQLKPKNVTITLGKTKCLFDDYEEFCEGSQRFSFPRIACTVSRRPMKVAVVYYSLS